MSSRTVDYFVLVVVLSVPFWVIGALTESLAESPPVRALMIVSPLAAALLITARDDGLSAALGLLKSSVDFFRIDPGQW